ncbi:MAG: dTDP-glucose 4,6-dehydratase [Candidatus Omnitrophica bacterium]|nr:dTDP-glucose 4,6-dehydratase [Candidatus Omnitrophota bacterium]MBU4478309.1 dTDP-glucose 4,6-dehydratase [Candidatus Omnitrophota bacterium]MCG2703452.1 dTDP-glucose 4,6-dehydratase [Candidatus Omnitrophota bacterium]
MKILVTGGLGFIGSNFIRYMLHKYPKLYIVNLDKQTYASCKSNLKDTSLNPRYAFIKGDICDKKIVLCAMRGCSAVLNFAAETHVDRSINDASVFLRTNISGVYVLLEAARELKVEKFIQIGTDEVYGSCIRGSFHEDDPLLPNSPYSASKASADILIRSYWKTYKFPAVITRSSNNFGPYQFPEKVIPLFITNLLEGKKVPLYGDGLNVRDWIYVLDNCRGIDLVLHKGKTGEIYNIGAGNEKNNLELTESILKEFGRSREWIKFVKDRPGHDRRYSLDTRKIMAMGFKTQVDFHEALVLTVNWYKENKSWWKKLKNRS